MQSRSILNHANVLKSSDVKAADSLIQLAIDNSSLTKDVGFIGEYGPTGGQQAYAGAFFDRSDSMKYKIFSGITGPTGPSESNIEFDVSGNLANLAIGSLSSSNLTSGLVPYTDSSQTLRNMTGVYWDSTNQILGFGTINPTGANLVIKDTNKAQLKLEFSSTYYSTISNESTTGLVITTNGPTWLSNLNNGDYFRFATNGTNDYIQSVNGNMFLSGINGANSTKCIILSDNMGVNVNTPSNGRLEVRDSTNAQLNLSNDDMNYTTFETNSSGNLEITPSGYKTSLINSSTGPELVLKCSTSQTILDAKLGGIVFANNSLEQAAIRSHIDIGGANNNADLRFYTTSDFVNVDLERMRIDRAGLLGVNETNPTSARCHITDWTQAQLKLEGTGSGTTTFETDLNGDLTITPSGSNIVTSGALSVGTTSTGGGKIRVVDTSGPQLRTEYDSSNYSTFTHGSDNTLLLSVSGEATGTRFWGPTGVKMPFGDTWLNWYEEQTGLSVSMSGPTAPTNIDYDVVRVGKMVNFSLKAFTGPSLYNRAFISDPISSNFWPQNGVSKPIYVIDNADSTVLGHLYLATNGKIYIDVGESTPFQATNYAGIYYDQTLTYQV